MKRRTLAIILVSSVLASGLIGWVASATIRSPAEEAARTNPPDASLIWVPVEHRALASEVVTRGTARFGSPQVLSLTQSALKPDAGVVSHTGNLGAELQEGGVAMLQSGRPVFLLSGPVPSYRDLGPGLEGDDVRQLQLALTRMGFYSGPVSGSYGAGTEAAVARWYQSAGFTPFRATTDQLADIRARESELLAARLEILSTNDGLALAGADTAAARSALDAAVRNATRGSAEVATARAEADAANAAANEEVRARQAAVDAIRSPHPGTPAEQAAARAELATAQNEQRDIRLAGEDAVDAAQAKVDQNPADPEAQDALDDAIAQAAHDDAAAAARTAAAQAALDAAVNGQPGTPSEIAAAESELATAKTAAVTTAREGARRIAEVEAAAEAASDAIGPANASLSAADRAERNAAESLAIRRRLAAMAESDLGTAQRRAGVQLPADEIVVVPSAPIRVSEVLVAIGDPATGPVLKVTNATVAVDGSLALDEAGLVEPGMTVKLDEPDLGVDLTGVVSFVADGPGTNGVDGFHVYFEVVVDGDPPSLPGTSVRIVVPVESSEGKSLVVPVSALVLASDGSSRLQVDRNGKPEDLRVTPGLSAKGYVVVTPEGGSLEEGDMVAVGKETGGRA